MLTPAERAATVDSIAAVQLPSGLIPWFTGGHADPWNHVEAAMALSLGGRRAEAERAYAWLADRQASDGSWANYYVGEAVTDPRRDANVCAYVATGAWQHFLATGDGGFLEALWPTVERAVGFALMLQRPGGEVAWSFEADGTASPEALLTGSSSVHLSLRCALAVAHRLGHERPDWELAAAAVATAVARRPQAFAPKDRWAMDWYYPVLASVLRGEAGRARLSGRWPEFVMDGLGVRCVSDQPWVTAAETCECVLACDAVGLADEARLLFSWAQHLRDDDGAYWTGCVHPEQVHFPGGERSTYTAAAVVLAAHALGGPSPAAGLFRGEGLPAVVELPEEELAAEP